MRKTIRLVGGPANGTTLSIRPDAPPFLRVPCYNEGEAYSIDVGGAWRWNGPPPPVAEVVEYVPAGLPLHPDVWMPRDLVRQDVSKAKGSLLVIRPGMAEAAHLGAWQGHDDRLVTTYGEVEKFADEVVKSAGKVAETRTLGKILTETKKALGVTGPESASVAATPSPRVLSERTNALLDRYTAAIRAGAKNPLPEFAKRENEARSALVQHLLDCERP